MTISHDAETARPGEPITVVRAYLAAMEMRDLPAAATFLAKGFRMTFPGGVTFTRPEDMTVWAGARYRSIGKTYEGFDEVAAPDGAVLYCFGVLHGVWPDGAAFRGIRFIDRFLVTDGLIRDQRVWNDLAEARP